MPFIDAFTSRRAKWLVLFLLAFLPLVATTGCSLFTPPPPVADSPQQALKDGEVREEDARAAERTNDTTEATERWRKTATYYGAVANKFAGTETGIVATIEQAEALDKGAKDKATAQRILYNALRQYKPAAFPETYPRLQSAYDDLIARIDKDNSATFFYTIMDVIVRALGNDPKVSPVLAIFVIAVLVTVLVWPFRVQQYRSFREMQRWTPELQKIQQQYKNDPQTAMLKQQEFYKEHGINQFAGCLPMLLQMPITILMYNVILYYQYHFTQATFLWINPASGQASLNMPWPLTGALGHHLGEHDLPMLVVYAISMYLTTKLMPTTPVTDPQQAEQQRMMTILMPSMFFVMMLQWQPASAFVLYWFVSNVLMLGQQWVIYKTLPQPSPVILTKGNDGDKTKVEEAGSGSGPLKPNPKLVSPKNRRK